MSNYIVSDSDLTSIANAIRTKGGTSASLAFPAEFVSAIGDIPSGGGDNLLDFLANELSEISIDGLTTLKKPHAFIGSSATKISLNDLTAFNAGANVYQDCKSLTVVSMPKISSYSSNPSSTFNGCTVLNTIDLGKWRFGGSDCANCSALKTIILRHTSVCELASTNAFTNTPFASGGSGGILYVPNSLISSYQSATNWSTILGYTNNQIKSIESTHTDPTAPIDLTLYYADGTPIT